MMRDIEVKDKNFSGQIKDIEKADIDNPLQIGASIPGKVVKVLVKKGEIVKENQPLIIIEAMKMETVMVSKADGVIDEIKVKQGEMAVSYTHLTLPTTPYV